MIKDNWITSRSTKTMANSTLIMTKMNCIAIAVAAKQPKYEIKIWSTMIEIDNSKIKSDPFIHSFLCL